MQLVWPQQAYLEGMRDALARGWSPDNLSGIEAAREELAEIDADPAAYLASQVDREAAGHPIKLPNGELATRRPGFRRWIWDGGFCGLIGLRWQRGTTDLPPYCLGHIGDSVVPWKQRLGYATGALALILEDARAEGLPHVIITTDTSNVASQRVIASNRSVQIGTFDKSPEHGGAPSLRFRIDLG